MRPLTRLLLEEEFLKFITDVMRCYTNDEMVQQIQARWLGVIKIIREDHMKINLLVYVYQTAGAVSPGIWGDYSGEINHPQQNCEMPPEEF